MFGRGNRRGLPARRWWALVACLLFAGLQPQARADTSSQLDQARARLTQLQQQVAGAETAATREQSNLARVLRSLSSRQASFQTVQQQLMASRGLLETARDRYTEVTDRIDQRAAEAYMQGPLAGLEAVLSASSAADLSDRVEFVSALQQHDHDLATQAAGQSEAVRSQVRSR